MIADFDRMSREPDEGTMLRENAETFIRRFAARLGLPHDAPAGEFERVLAERLGFSGWDLDWAFHWWMGSARSLGRRARPRPKP